MGHVSIGVEVQRNTDGDTPSKHPAAVIRNNKKFRSFKSKENLHTI